MSKASHNHLRAIYKRSDKPKTILQLLHWVIFEPLLLTRFSQRLEHHEVILLLFRLTPVIIVFSGISFLIGVGLLYLSTFVTTALLPWFEESIREGLATEGQSVFDHYLFLVENSIGLWLGILATGLAIAMHRALLLKQQTHLITLLSGIVTFALLSGIITGFSAVFTQGWQGWLLIFLLASLAIGSQFFPKLFLLGFRFYLYPIYLLQGSFYASLTHNPYLRDGYLWLPIWGLQKRLLRQAFKQPDTGLQFAEFLFNYRPAQSAFAAHMVHASTAGQWRQAGLETELDLLQPPILDNGKMLVPSVTWLSVFRQLQEIRGKLQRPNDAYRLRTIRRTRGLLRKLATLARTEWDTWYQHYAPVLAHWERRLRTLEQGLDEDNTAIASNVSKT